MILIKTSMHFIVLFRVFLFNRLENEFWSTIIKKTSVVSNQWIETKTRFDAGGKH